MFKELSEGQTHYCTHRDDGTICDECLGVEGRYAQLHNDFKDWHSQLHTESSGWDEDHENFEKWLHDTIQQTIKKVLQGLVDEYELTRNWEIDYRDIELYAEEYGIELKPFEDE